MDLIREYWWVIVVLLALLLAFILLRPKQRVMRNASTIAPDTSANTVFCSNKWPMRFNASE